MVKIYFVCMGNYYRSRLAQELACFYADKYGIEIEADSGGLSDVENSNNVGPIAKATLLYLADKGVTPVDATRPPKSVNMDDVSAADIVVLTDANEQKDLFLQNFSDYKGRLVEWQARDQMYDPWLQTPFLIDKRTHDFIKELKNNI